MSAGDGDQQPPEHALWDEEFQRNILNAEWPTTVPPSITTPYTSIAPFTSGMIDEHIAVPVFPALPSPEYPPMTSHLLPSNDPSMSYPSAASRVPTSAHDTALRFHSQVLQAFSGPNDYLETPHIDPSENYGYLPPASSSTPIDMRAGLLHADPIHDADFPYATHRPSISREVVPISPPPSLPTSRPSGPERSRRSTGQRIDPLGARSGGRTRQTKRTAACWRCRKYRKPCDDDLICASCQVGNFRVWPPALGCRRDNLEGFALAIIPPSTEDLLRTLPPNIGPTPSWRHSVLNKSLAREDLFSDTSSQEWSSLAVKVHATGLFGMELVSLLNILDTYQESQKTKNPVLEATCTLFSASCDYYNIFVISAGNDLVLPPKENIAATIQDIRTSMARSLSLFLGLCVSSKRADWFPSVLSFAVFVASVAMFMDAAVAMPAAARTELWDDVTSFCLGLRAQLYPTALDLLRIRANNDKQMAPLKLNCWNWIPEKAEPENISSASSSIKPNSTEGVTSAAGRNGELHRESASQPSAVQHGQSNPPSEEPLQGTLPSPKLIRNPEGMRLVGNDEAAFDGFASLQIWLNVNEDVLKQGKILFSKDPFTSPTVAAVCTLAPIFGVR